MDCRWALLTFLGALASCDAPPQSKEPAQPPVLEKAAAPRLSKQQTDERSAHCTKMSREQFHRAWKDGTENTADGKVTAEFANHYNARLNTCFYLLTVASAGARRKMLFDVNGGEQYGEYVGPETTSSPKPDFPKTCRVESFYCASEREWDVLVEPYMQD